MHFNDGSPDRSRLLLPRECSYHAWLLFPVLSRVRVNCVRSDYPIYRRSAWRRAVNGLHADRAGTRELARLFSNEAYIQGAYDIELTIRCSCIRWRRYSTRTNVVGPAFSENTPIRNAAYASRGLCEHRTNCTFRRREVPGPWKGSS